VAQGEGSKFKPQYHKKINKSNSSLGLYSKTLSQKIKKEGSYTNCHHSHPNGPWICELNSHRAQVRRSSHLKGNPDGRNPPEGSKASEAWEGHPDEHVEKENVGKQNSKE
jgi:hypothetical protein